MCRLCTVLRVASRPTACFPWCKCLCTRVCVRVSVCASVQAVIFMFVDVCTCFYTCTYLRMIKYCVHVCDCVCLSLYMFDGKDCHCTLSECRRGQVSPPALPIFPLLSPGWMSGRTTRSTLSRLTTWASRNLGWKATSIST